MSSRFLPSNPPVTGLVAGVTDSATTFSVPSGTYADFESPTLVVLGGNEQVSVVSVTLGNPEVWTVTRGVDSVPEAHEAGDPVEKVYTATGVRRRNRLRATVSGNYTPPADVEVLHLTLGGNTTILPPEDNAIGSLRVFITQGSTARTLAWSPVYSLLGYTAPTRNATNSISFEWDGRPAGTASSWWRQQ